MGKNVALMKGSTEPRSFDIAAALKAAGDQMRLEILKIMRRDSFGVLELCQIFNIQQPSMSHHLKVMSKAGLLDSRREGNSIFYKRVLNADKSTQRLLDKIYMLADAAELPAAIAKGVSAVQEVRKSRSQQFFQENVERFHEQQDLIAGFLDYGQAIQSLINVDEKKSWLEIGPGAGELLKSASDNFGRVYALDISEEMLERSRSLVGEGRVEFMLGDTAEALGKGVRADCVTCSMVLHHVPSPASMIRDMADMLNEHGQLLICDLDEHDQEWAKTSCGDLWMGFAADEISQWAQEAGLAEGREQFLALRNGFRVQIREFLKRN